MDDMSDHFHANGNSNLSYTGGATVVSIMVHGNHSNRTIEIDGVNVVLSTSSRYTFTGGMTVNLRNTKNNPNSWGQAKGHWKISISGTVTEITPDPST